MVLSDGSNKNFKQPALAFIQEQKLKNLLQTAQKEIQLTSVSCADIAQPVTLKFYKDWLSENLNGDMEYLKTHLPLKENPKLLETSLKSVITVFQNYTPVQVPSPVSTSLRVALYAQNADYHFWLKEKLNALIEKLKEAYPNEVFLPFVDSGPVLERDLAYKSGLGWFGKNTCIISAQHGSLGFLGEILTSLPLQETIPLHEDLCGRCTKCIEVCPTQALTEKKLDANRCISYLTIEAKGIPSLELRNKMGDWLFGCDLCQTVCPWNQKKLKLTEALHQKSTEHFLNLNADEKLIWIQELKTLLTLSNKQLQKKFLGSALFRAAGFKIKRNALIVIANRKIIELKPEVLQLTQDAKLSELAHWTLDCLNEPI